MTTPCPPIRSFCSKNTAGTLKKSPTNSKARWASVNLRPAPWKPSRATRYSSASPTTSYCFSNNTSAKAKDCATNCRRKNSRTGSKRQALSAPPETSSTPRSNEPPSAPSDSSGGCVSGFTNKLSGTIPSPASRKSGAAFIHSFQH